MSEILKSEDERYLQSEIKKYWGSEVRPSKNYRDSVIVEAVNESGYLKQKVDRRTVQYYRLKLGLKNSNGRKPKSFSEKLIKNESFSPKSLPESNVIYLPGDHAIIGFHKAEASGKCFLLTSVGVLEIKTQL